MQRKAFRIEQTFATARAHASEARRDIGEREAAAASLERRGAASDAALRRELALAHDFIARHRRELAALIGSAKERSMARGASELCAAVDGMDRATQSILKSAESIDDGARALAATLKGDYERTLAQDIQDRIVEVYEACNFQDLAGQRIGKVIALLGTVEERLVAMLAHGDGREDSARPGAKPAAERGLINGPKLDGDEGHASQRDIDALFGR